MAWSLLRIHKFVHEESTDHGEPTHSPHISLRTTGSPGPLAEGLGRDSANISPPKLVNVSISRHRKVKYLGESVLTALPLLTLFQRTRDATFRC